MKTKPRIKLLKLLGIPKNKIHINIYIYGPGIQGIVQQLKRLYRFKINRRELVTLERVIRDSII